MASMTASITMSQDTVGSLTASGYTLDAFEVVNTNDDGTIAHGLESIIR